MWPAPSSPVRHSSFVYDISLSRFSGGAEEERDLTVRDVGLVVYRIMIFSHPDQVCSGSLRGLVGMIDDWCEPGHGQEHTLPFTSTARCSLQVAGILYDQGQNAAEQAGDCEITRGARSWSRRALLGNVLWQRALTCGT